MSRTSNDNKIIKAFAKAKAAVKASIKDTMIELLDLGVEYCLNAHDATHQMHLEIGDSYAWMLLYNGKKVDSKIYAQGAEPQGNATKALATVKRNVPQAGWVGIILAGLEPVTYFNLRYEFIPMRAGMQTLSAQDFDKYFNKVVIK